MRRARVVGAVAGMLMPGMGGVPMRSNSGGSAPAPGHSSMDRPPASATGMKPPGIRARSNSAGTTRSASRRRFRSLERLLTTPSSLAGGRLVNMGQTP